MNVTNVKVQSSNEIQRSNENARKGFCMESLVIDVSFEF